MEVQQRIRMRFRLRSLLLLVLVGIVALAHLTESGRRQKHAVEALARQGASVNWCRMSDHPIVMAIEDCLIERLGIDFVCQVVLLYCDTEGPDPALLDDLPHITHVVIHGYPYKGTSLVDLLRRLPRLTELMICHDCKFTAADMSSLQALPHLQRLRLDFECDQTGEEALHAVSHLKQLRSLEVICPQLTAEMVADLAKATGPNEILVRTQAAPAPALAKALQDANPRCKVEKYGRSYYP